MMRSDLVKLQLHRVVVQHIERDPERVRQIGLRNIEQMRERYNREGWGRSGTRWLDQWESLLRGPIPDLIKMCLSLDEQGIDMRQVGPFVGVMTQEERMDALRAVGVAP